MSISKDRLLKITGWTLDEIEGSTIVEAGSGAGRFGARLLPICDYSQLGLSDDLNIEWSILDTFDMYSPKFDKPQTINTVLKWFKDAGLDVIPVRYGLNGIVAEGKYNNKH